jgi:hypothetical protein
VAAAEAPRATLGWDTLLFIGFVVAIFLRLIPPEVRNLESQWFERHGGPQNSHV